MSPETLVVGRWHTRFQGRCLPSVTGRGGIVRPEDKREGDGATPAGNHRIVGLLYRPDRISSRALPIWAEPIGPGDFWSDDPADGAYNTAVRAPHGFGHEALRRPDPLYDLVLVTDWNWPSAVAGRGSAIFLHRWRKPRHPTAGCVAFAPDVMLWLARNVAPGTPLVVRP
ncbi:MAG: L,D-transpeptidase family protein [Paracoccaceae bacterium]